MQPTKTPTQSGAICRFFSRPGGCRHGDSCRFRHTSENGTPPSEVPVDSTNNQNPPPDHTATRDNATAFVRDVQYYCLDDIGVFLVDGVLFRVHATQTFGPRPTSVPESIGGISPTYIEDILPRLPSSSDSNPIALPGVTVDQFRGYLLAIMSRPGDAGYSTFATGYNEDWSCSRLQEVYNLYANIATLSRLFGMVKVEAWAMDMLDSIFTNPRETLTEFASLNWSADSLLHLRSLSRNTRFDQPVMRFIQFFISINLKDATNPASFNALTCVDLYNIIKDSNSESVLLGCMFLSLLSLGHRSWIWSQRVNKKDRAILYMGLVRFNDASSELNILEWLDTDPPCKELAESQLCNTCNAKTIEIWRKSFEELRICLGCIPFTDIVLLSQVAMSLWEFHQDWRQELAYCCGYAKRSYLSLPGQLPGFLDHNIRKLYEGVASLHRKFTEEV